jgi:hypothetical protein
MLTSLPARVGRRIAAVAVALLLAALALAQTIAPDTSAAATAPQNGVAGQDCDAPGYVPMISGRDKQTPGDIQWQLDRLYANGYRTVLAFNEPNQPGQSVMSVDKALGLWPTLTSRDDVTVSSPAVSGGNGGNEWLTAFMKGVADRNLRVDFVAAHFYGWTAGSCTAARLQSYLNWIKSVAGGRPIWVTELGCLDVSNTDERTVRKFYHDAVRLMKRMNIERWSWYTAEKHHELVTNGQLTDLGKDYAAVSRAEALRGAGLARADLWFTKDCRLKRRRTQARTDPLWSVSGVSRPVAATGGRGRRSPPAP